MSERLALLTRFGARWLIPRNRSEASAQCARLDPHACDWRAIERDGGVAPRADDVINFGGVKLQPEDVEAVIAQHPDVEDAAVVGAPHAMAGTVPVALVVLRRPVTPQAVMAFCQSRIDASRLPVAVLPGPEILRSADGKILRQRLLETYKITART
jgi:long-chain acyl-CoA synthetase